MDETLLVLSSSETLNDLIRAQSGAICCGPYNMSWKILRKPFIGPINAIRLVNLVSFSLDINEKSMLATNVGDRFEMLDRFFILQKITIIIVLSPT